MNKNQQELAAIALFVIVLMILFFIYSVNSLNSLHKHSKTLHSELLIVPDVPDYPVCALPLESKMKPLNESESPAVTYEGHFNIQAYIHHLKTKSSMNMLILIKRIERQQRHWSTLFPNGNVYTFVHEFPSWRPANTFTGIQDNVTDLERALQCFNVESNLDIVEHVDYHLEFSVTAINYLFEHGLKPGMP